MPLTAEQHASRGSWIENEFTKDTYFLLQTLDRFNLDSRRLIAETFAAEVYRPLLKQERQFAALDQLTRRYLLDVAAIEIMSTVFMALRGLWEASRGDEVAA